MVSSAAPSGPVSMALAIDVLSAPGNAACRSAFRADGALSILLNVSLIKLVTSRSDLPNPIIPPRKSCVASSPMPAVRSTSPISDSVLKYSAIVGTSIASPLASLSVSE